MYKLRKIFNLITNKKQIVNNRTILKKSVIIININFFNNLTHSTMTTKKYIL